MLTTLKATAFKGEVSNEQMMALLIVADQYGLNPWTKEIYAFPDRQNGIVPVIGVDGWARIINSHDQFDGMDFEQDAESCTCIIYRKDRGHPVRVTEYMAECRRSNVGPWNSHPRRMLRHKAMIQCARLAFGFVGVYDQDEAERIVERDITPVQEFIPASDPAASRTQAVKDKIKGRAQSAPKAEAAPQDAEPAMTYAHVADAIAKAGDLDALALAQDMIRSVEKEDQRDELGELAAHRRTELAGA
jgi:phage recombination protein Bet